MKRIFVAIDISTEAKEKVVRYIENLKHEFPKIRVGWDKPEKLHLTLKFLGDIDDSMLENLNKIVQKIALKKESFNITIKQTGVFPNKNKPRILWLGIKDEKGILKVINNDLETELEKIGFEKEKRNFKPHLTIGRIREPYNAKHLAEKHLANEFEPVEFSVAEIVIYESELKPTGSIYKIVRKCKLN